MDEFKRYEIPENAKWVRCKACDMEITFIKEGTKFIPVTKAKINHFIDCPAADRFRKRK